MPSRFIGKTVVIVGASGGLGAALARAFAAEGATLALAARRPLAPGDYAATTHYADLTDPASLTALRDAVLAAHQRVDVVVNAAGYDVRKSFTAHTPDDFRRTVDINLLGALTLTQTFLPVLASGVIVHLGGFADGRLAFPFYSADVATRAGVRAFAEAVNRELALARRPVVVAYFSPSPADTAAERPFHTLWQRMGTPIVPPEQVAAELVDAVARRQPVRIMGGWLTRVFAALNTVAPALADAVLMNAYGKILQQHLGGSHETGQLE